MLSVSELGRLLHVVHDTVFKSVAEYNDLSADKCPRGDEPRRLTVDHVRVLTFIVDASGEGGLRPDEIPELR